MFCDPSNRNVRYGSKNNSEMVTYQDHDDIVQDPHHPKIGTDMIGPGEFDRTLSGPLSFTSVPTMVRRRVRTQHDVGTMLYQGLYERG